jgi:molecular chaperone DnaK (HSP70)
MESFAGLSVDERKLVVGIDLGATFSGLAWAETRRVGDESVDVCVEC